MGYEKNHHQFEGNNQSQLQTIPADITPAWGGSLTTCK